MVILVPRQLSPSGFKEKRFWSLAFIQKAQNTKVAYCFRFDVVTIKGFRGWIIVRSHSSKAALWSWRHVSGQNCNQWQRENRGAAWIWAGNPKIKTRRHLTPACVLIHFTTEKQSVNQTEVKLEEFPDEATRCKIITSCFNSLINTAAVRQTGDVLETSIGPVCTGQRHHRTG